MSNGQTTQPNRPRVSAAGQGGRVAVGAGVGLALANLVIMGLQALGLPEDAVADARTLVLFAITIAGGYLAGRIGYVGRDPASKVPDALGKILTLAAALFLPLTGCAGKWITAGDAFRCEGKLTYSESGKTTTTVLEDGTEEVVEESSLDAGCDAAGVWTGPLSDNGRAALTGAAAALEAVADAAD